MMYIKLIAVTAFLVFILPSCTNPSKPDNNTAQCDLKQDFKEGKFDAVIVCASAFLKNEKNDTLALSYRAFAYSQLGKYSEALEDYNRLLKIDHRAKIYSYRASVYRKMGMYDKAKNDYDISLSMDSTSDKAHDAYVNRGLIYAAWKDNRNAMLDFTQALKINPKSIGALISKAQVNSSMNNFNEAIRNLDLAVAIDPNNASVYYNYGYVCYVAKKEKESLSFLSRAISMDSTDSDFFISRAKVYDDLNNKDLACKDLFKAAKLGSEEAIKQYNIYCKN